MVAREFGRVILIVYGTKKTRKVNMGLKVGLCPPHEDLAWVMAGRPSAQEVHRPCGRGVDGRGEWVSGVGQWSASVMPSAAKRFLADRRFSCLLLRGRWSRADHGTALSINRGLLTARDVAKCGSAAFSPLRPSFSVDLFILRPTTRPSSPSLTFAPWPPLLPYCASSGTARAAREYLLLGDLPQTVQYRTQSTPFSLSPPPCPSQTPLLRAARTTTAYRATRVLLPTTTTFTGTPNHHLPPTSRLGFTNQRSTLPRPVTPAFSAQPLILRVHLSASRLHPRNTSTVLGIRRLPRPSTPSTQTTPRLA